ncbi:MAG: hypothetical protein M1817_006373 [Caeruleum heppii]|nr:MAG: hypothetical protein M1817_006373 [Caeruleum heppii]
MRHLSDYGFSPLHGQAHPTGVQNHRDLYQLQRRQYEVDLAAGNLSPFVYPIQAYSVLLVILYLFIDHRRRSFLRFLRFPLFAYVVYSHLATIYRCRSPNPASGLGIGLLAAWAIEWSAALLLFNHPQQDFQRIERRSVQPQRLEQLPQPLANGISSSLHRPDTNSPKLRRENGRLDHIVAQPKATHTSRGNRAYWQSFPEHSYRARLSWVLDLSSNFRGSGWNKGINGLPALPADVKSELAGDQHTTSSGTSPIPGPTGNLRYLTKESLLRRKIGAAILACIVLDIIKLFMMKDPYFWGFVEEGPPSYLPRWIRDSFVMTRTYRLVLSLGIIYTTLNLIFGLAPIFFVGLLGSGYLGVRGEPWLYPDMNGAFRSVLDKGLAGWWGGWWHQIFRFAFSAPSAVALERLQLNVKSPQAKFLQLFIAFTMSGLLHFCGSYTLLPATKPLNSFFFFFVQTFGITAQTFFTALLQRYGVIDRIPKTVRQLSNFVFVHVWFYYTGPLLTDDFARGSVWLFEPIPISPLRGLGLGLREEGWYCWAGKILFWHRGNLWWESGIAI